MQWFQKIAMNMLAFCDPDGQAGCHEINLLDEPACCLLFLKTRCEKIEFLKE